MWAHIRRNLRFELEYQSDVSDESEVVQKFLVGDCLISSFPADRFYDTIRPNHFQEL